MNKQPTTDKYQWIVYIGLTLIILSAVWIIIQNEGMIEISADHDMTVPFWHKWVISTVLILLMAGLPSKSADNNPFKTAEGKIVRRQSVILVISAVLFAVILNAFPADNAGSYMPFVKIPLLIIVPAIMISSAEHKRLSKELPDHSYMKNNQWIFPGVAATAWIILEFFSPLGSPDTPEYQMAFIALATGALFSFLLNSVLEELFYRVWLQTRLEALLGTWPAIMISSVLWAVWHMAIQGGGSLDIAFSNVMVNQGVLGLFLGFLWAKYRNVWVLIIIHGLINLPVQLITGYF